MLTTRTRTFFVIQFLLTSFTTIHSARICIFSIVSSPLSYRSGYEVLLETLLDQGHEVTLFSNFPYVNRATNNSTSKVKYIFPEIARKYITDFYEYISPLQWRSIGKFHTMGDMHPILHLDLCNILLQSTEVMDWIKTFRHYDLFIVDSLWNECGIGLSHVFKAKLILFSLHTNLYSWNLDAFGSPVEPYSFPDMQYAVAAPLTFFQRLRSTFRAIRWQIYRNAFTFYQTRKFFRNHLQLPDFPSIRELEENAKVFFVNSHHSEEPSHSLSPIFVSVGGIHIRDGRSEEVFGRVNNFLKKRSNSKGFILVNIGCSPDTIRNLNDSVQSIFNSIGAMKEHVNFILPCKKGFVQEDGTNVPENALVLETCSSEITSLLGHPDAKGLLTHGDLLDIQEAIHYAIPVVALPVAFDQDANAERLVNFKRGIRLEITNLSERDLVDAIEDLIKNKMYKSNMEKASNSFRNRQVKPLQTVIWWIDYVLRNPDLDELKPIGIEQDWYIRRSLDIWFPIFTLVGIGLSLVIILIIVKFKEPVLLYLSKVLLSESRKYKNKTSDNSSFSDDEDTNHVSINRRRSARLSNNKKD